MNQSGLSLIEIMLSLFLASLMLLSLSKLYLLGKGEYHKTAILLHEQLELLWVKDLLTQSIRQAGFTPCVSVDQLELRDTSNNIKYFPKIRIKQGDQSLIQVNRMSEHSISIKEILSSTELLISNKQFLNNKHPILIADCERAEIHYIDKISKFGNAWIVHLTKPLFYTYKSSTFIGEWIEESWLIKNNSLYYKLRDLEDISSLFFSLSAQIKQAAQHQFVELNLGVKGNDTKKMMVAIRSV